MTRVVNVNKFGIKKFYYCTTKNHYKYKVIKEGNLIKITIPLLLGTITFGF